MKKYLKLGIFLFPVCAYSQVGINTDSPKSTLDIVAKNPTGNTTKAEGLLVPRVDRQRAQSMSGVIASTLLYIDNAATGSQMGTAVNIDAIGYYYYNGTAWVKLSTSSGISNNIYNANGSLSGNRIVTQGANTLAFTGTASNAFSVDGTTLSVDAANNKVGIGTTSPLSKFVVNGDMQLINDLKVGGSPSVLGNAGTTGQVLTSAGAGLAPTWTTQSAVVNNNIYNADGTLLSNRTVTQGTSTLTFTGGNAANGFSVDGTTFSIDALNNRIGIGTTSPSETLDVGAGNVRIRNINTNAGASADNVVVVDGTGVLKTVAQSNLRIEPWYNQATGTQATTNTQNIYQTGKVAIGASTIPSFTAGSETINPMLHIAGDISTTGRLWTTNSVYADYVFEKYFNGKSAINPNYEFKSLNYVRDFIKKNNHLPGVTSIADLGKANNGYTFDMTKLTIQSLEKIEELYIHTIQQKDKIDAQQAEIEKFKKESEETKRRLEIIEKLLLKYN